MTLKLDTFAEKDKPYIQYRYGDAPEHFLRIFPPQIEKVSGVPASGPCPVALIVHGGWWKSKWTIENAAHMSLAPDFAKRGWVGIEIEYRRVGHEGGGYDGSMQDVLRAYSLLVDVPGKDGWCLDLRRVLVFGHSAGGQLVLWLASRAGSHPEDFGRMPVPQAVIACSPCTDLIAAQEAKLSDEGDACERFMGCSLSDGQDAIEKYKAASPRWLPYPKVPVLAVGGGKDVDVPSKMVRDYVTEMEAAGAGAVRYFELSDADHYKVFSTGESWSKILKEVVSLLQTDPDSSGMSQQMLDLLRVDAEDSDVAVASPKLGPRPRKRPSGAPHAMRKRPSSSM